MSNKAFPVSVEVARAALAVIPSDDRDVWWRMGMALKSEFGEDGLPLFEEWSERSSSFDAKAVKSTWKSIKPGGRVTIGTLIGEAKNHGFNPKDFAPATPVTAAEKARLREEREARDRMAEVERLRTQEAAALEAENLWHAAAIGGTSAYLKRKGVAAHGIRYRDDGTVLVPLRDADGKLWNVQKINAKGEKRFPRGGRVSGCFHLVGDIATSDWVLIAEGYATAVTLFEATGFAVVVSFNRVNMRNVAGVVRQLAPEARLMFCADDDSETEGRTGKNPGILSATAAAAAVGGYWCKPEGLAAGATDFNDLARGAGIEELRAQLEAAFAAAGYANGKSGTLVSVAPKSEPEGEVTRQEPPTKHRDRKETAKPHAGKAEARGAGQAARPFFNVDEGGVWYHGFSPQGDPLPAQWICSEMHVTARSRDAANGEWGYLLEFKDGDNNPKRWAMPASMLAGDGTAYRAVLLSMGLRIGAGTAAKNHLHVYIQNEQTDVRVRCTDRIGWHDDVYVLPDRTIGEGEEMVMFQASGGVVSQFKQRGTLPGWREEVASLCRGNSRLLFCVSAAFAAPLLYLAHVPSGGFHIWGDSSSGKSTAFKVAGSVFGGKDYPRNWRMTDNALETVAAQHSDALLLLDEIAQVDPKVVGDTVYMLANETGKGRATQTASARKVSTWRLLFLSDGEVSLANHMEHAGKGVKAGHDVRMAHISADAGYGFGVYETLNGFPSGAALSDHLVSKAHQNFGTAGMAFIEYVVQHVRMLTELLQSNVPTLAREMCPVDAHGQVSRVATRFALVGVAGELATNAGITGWAPGEATSAATTCFHAWLEGRGGAGNVEHTAIMRQVSAFFQAHGESRFVWWHRAMDDHKPNTINRAGFKRMLAADGSEINSNSDHHKAYGDKMHPADAEEARQEYFVLPEVFRNEICKGFSVQTVTRLLIERGVLMPEGKSSATRQERLPGIGKTRVYRFRPEVVGMDV